MHMAGWSIGSSKWNVYLDKGLRMNNNLKGWHSNVKKIAGKNHLNIFEIIELFKKEQASIEVEIRQLRAGGARRRQPPRHRNRDIRI